MNTSMKKIIMLAILAMTVFSCSLLDNEAYQEMKRDRAERGINGCIYMKRICQNKGKINMELYFPAIWNSTSRWSSD